MTKGARLDGKGSQRFDSDTRRLCVRLPAASGR